MGKRQIIIDGPHACEVLSVLRGVIRSQQSLKSIREKAMQIIERSVDPRAALPKSSSDGLLYGLIQSGKTSIITVAAAMAADNGFQCVIILTSDINPLYEQTLKRVKKVFRGLSVLGKNDWKDALKFKRQLRTPPLVIVCSKNGSRLNNLLEAFKASGARRLSVLLIDDEADQASLNTKTSKRNEEISRINRIITNLRGFFRVNTYLQVTATPQALFLQRPDHQYRPSFTVLSNPGEGYIGGEIFFGTHNNLLRYVELDEVESLRATYQPSPTGTIPKGLREALFTFFVGATAKIIQNHSDGYAFLCHVSLNQRDHKHIENLMGRFKEDTINRLRSGTGSQYEKLICNFKVAYDDLKKSESTLPAFHSIIEKIKFYILGTNIQLINATSNEEIKLDAVYNIFVGGNKLGRGVTIRNLLVSYYGRNPKRPNSDTVLQHARMYGYRSNEIGVTRLFLPEKLANHFRSIHQMEDALRDLVSQHPRGQFEGLYISSPLQATRRNVLDPNSLGMYVAGRSYNPAYPLRTEEMKEITKLIDDKLSAFKEKKAREVTVDFIIELIKRCKPDPDFGIELWDLKNIVTALEKLKSLKRYKAYLVVSRGRKLKEARDETQGILSGGEESLAHKDALALFMYRQDSVKRREVEVWWPQLRFPEGNYVLAFSFDW